jgi:two-component system cell cycle response regulator CtrA
MSKDVARLLALVDEQKERIRQLEDSLGFHLQSPLALSLTPAHAALFGCLYMRPLASREALLQAHGTAIGCSEDVEPKTLDVHITKLRQKLKPHGIEIETVWGRGYRMTDESKSIVCAMFVAEAAQQAAMTAHIMEHGHAKPGARARAV